MHQSVNLRPMRLNLIGIGERGLDSCQAHSNKKIKKLEGDKRKPSYLWNGGSEMEEHTIYSINTKNLKKEEINEVKE